MFIKVQFYCSHFLYVTVICKNKLMARKIESHREWLSKIVAALDSITFNLITTMPCSSNIKLHSFWFRSSDTFFCLRSSCITSLFYFGPQICVGHFLNAQSLFCRQSKKNNKKLEIITDMIACN